MRAHYLQHVPFEGLGSIGPWLQAAGHPLSGTRFYEAAALPPPSAVDLLIVMGGPMSVHDESEHPWLADEKRFIRTCILAGKPVLGICLGAQLIAATMGARVYRHSTKEIGWFPIYAVRPDGPPTFRFPDAVDAFHWHGETFDLPDGAQLLARSDACPRQAFQLGPSVIALQFHLETTPETARALISQCRAELRPAEHVQPEAALLAAPPEKYLAINRLMGQVLAFLTGGVGRDGSGAAFGHRHSA